MCGIIGYVGNEPFANSVLLRGLEALEYRGYDSAGIATIVDMQFQITKTKGKVSFLKEQIHSQKIPEATIGIGHTRWATHGIPSSCNAHPHCSFDITVVHNGIIENYEDLKKELEEQGYEFASQTDTEVCTAFIHSLTSKLGIIPALQQAYHQLHGSFALAILVESKPDTIYAMRKDSPLVIAHTGTSGYLASDLSAIVEYTNTYYPLDCEEICILTKDSATFLTLNNQIIEKTPSVTKLSAQQIHKQGFDHFMLKEIHEQPEIIANLLQYYVHPAAPKRIHHLPDFRAFRQIHIVGCGSAYHAGLIGKRMIQQLTRIPVTVEVASEYRYQNPILTPDTLVIIISQSGETADSLAVLRHVKASCSKTLAIVNVMDSSIAKEADYACMTLARTEISVATTKAFLAQLMVLALISLEIGFVHQTISQEELDRTLQDAINLPNILAALLEEKKYLPYVRELAQHQHVFYIGRGTDLGIAMEACLKLKEIAYIHCEAYAAGELKHGSIALIEQDTPVIGILSDPYLYPKTVSNLEEVRARGAAVLVFATNSIAARLPFSDMIAVPDCHPILQPLLFMIPLQLLAYECAKSRGCEIDQPRNLAKSVTVE